MSSDETRQPTENTEDTDTDESTPMDTFLGVAGGIAFPDLPGEDGATAVGFLELRFVDREPIMIDLPVALALAQQVAVSAGITTALLGQRDHPTHPRGKALDDEVMNWALRQSGVRAWQFARALYTEAATLVMVQSLDQAMQAHRDAWQDEAATEDVDEQSDQQ